jgi:indolepyruvate ferredoxin oxidoreductase, alpha subunit
MNKLLSGNEAIARGAFEAGVTVAVGYPGTPSTEILEAIVAYKNDIFCEWAPNEKVAFEVAAGASLAGARSIVTMKHVGLNVAADPLMTLAYIGTVGGFVACVADDPGMHSSQNEQDTRQFARFAKIPVLEPADSQEASDFTALALEISEKYRTPVILRTTTRISHSRSLVEFGERTPPNQVAFVKDPPRFVPIPIWGRKMRVRVEERLSELAEAACTSIANRIEWRDRSLGIIADGIAYQYVREAFPEASVLKLGWAYPFPDRLLCEFADGVDTLLVVEELDDLLEEHIKAMGIACEGKNIVSRIGELSTPRLLETRARLEGKGAAVDAPQDDSASEAADLPARPPVLCAGCPHRGIFHALSKFDVVVTGDIGCYSLGVFAPLERIDTILCMGAGVSMAHGMNRAGEPRPVVGMVGDSTFFHSGITGLLDIVYNQGTSTTIVVDNRITAMTGHQDHPGTGRTLMGKTVDPVSIEAIGRACGMKNVVTVDPYQLKPTVELLKKALYSDEPWLIVSRGGCPLHERKPHGPPLRVAEELCIDCGACLKLGCPAIEKGEGKPQVNRLLCTGCLMCEQVCPVDAFKVEKEGENE